MTYLRGRTLLTVFFMVALTLVAIIYHILNNDNDLTEDSSNVARRQKIEAQMLENYRANNKNYESSSNNKYNSMMSNESLFKGHKIVHLDLKGAPPVMDYYRYLFKVFKDLGATGILIEYEDMFPYKGKLKDISAENCYSKADVMTIENLAKENGLIVIPLVQTFGHLEFILKLDAYKNYREVMRYPQVVCPTYNGTQDLIREMIDQVINAHPNIKYLHIGADEVYYIGECSRCLDEMVKRQWSKKKLFLNHVESIVRYIKNKYPHITVLMWDDEFRDITPEEIFKSGLNKLIEPVIWKYTSDLSTTLVDQLWENYAAVWPEVWIATAFKGATKPDRYYTDILYHIENHQRWLEIIDKYSHQIKFKGAILTGWQRYDHFSVLCELLAPALPSLAANLAILRASNVNNFISELPSEAVEALDCQSTVSLTIPEPHYGWTKCKFRGVEIYSVILRLFGLNQEINQMEQDNTFKGWLKPYNVKYKFSNPSHVERAVTDLNKFKMELLYIEKEMQSAMSGIYDNYTFTEWIETYVAPLNDKINSLWDAKESILEKNSWPRRPLQKTEL
ncbi:hexosaminidase D-like isoform X2 [Chelonus insularis]|uniref:hexosaminidase D-like isoform X2 n=1 Tax=Chelonus insularis TaxID=460826 RepID=UPI00158B8AEF|nr:hexosaminidase D-like isoform X2 [Chelonus insularis]XP_034938129.1 hexosaminidase D-like isoform X2 [Chelonus insularis]